MGRRRPLLVRRTEGVKAGQFCVDAGTSCVGKGGGNEVSST